MSSADKLLQAEDFSPLVGRQFSVAEPDGGEPRATLVLEECRELGYTIPGIARKPFALLFSGSSVEALEQQMYTMSNPDFESTDIFIVPIREVDGIRSYEAIFS